jgi:hypothetical protein
MQVYSGQWLQVLRPWVIVSGRWYVSFKWLKRQYQYSRKHGVKFSLLSEWICPERENFICIRQGSTHKVALDYMIIIDTNLDRWVVTDVDTLPLINIELPTDNNMVIQQNRVLFNAEKNLDIDVEV